MKLGINKDKFNIIMFTIIVLPFILLIEYLLVKLMTFVFLFGIAVFLILNGLIILFTCSILEDLEMIEFYKKDDSYE